LTNQQAELLQNRWKSVTYFVVSREGPQGQIIGPGFKTFGLACLWLRLCRLWVPTAEHTFIAQKPIKAKSAFLQA